jgi:hypothetical protein
MKEDFLYFLWKFQLFNHQGLETQCGLPVQVRKAGILNNDAGPDFSASHVVIDEMEWVGNVEMHVRSSQWFKHGHQNDVAYDSVVLHVVWDYNMPINDSKGREIPTIALSKITQKGYLSNYQLLNQSLVDIACQEKISEVPDVYLNGELHQQIICRLERKTQKWKENKTGELKTVFYELLAQSFGFKVNADAFCQVAEQLPLTILLKHGASLKQVEALLFGVSGMLSSAWNGEYPQGLFKEWKYLQHKFQLPEVSYVQWKFAKMRPPNFPTVKLAQFAVLMMGFQDLFDAVNANKPLSIIKQYFEKGTSLYWATHYVFDKESIQKDKALGVNSFRSVVINAIIPFIYFKYKRDEQHNVFDYLVGLLESLPAEKNHKVDLFLNLGLKPKNALETQGLLELLDYKCLPKKCLSCSVGNHLVRKK